MQNPICIITGMERTGTTLLSQMLNAHPRVAAGVECGLLLREPRHFDRSEPFWEWLTLTGWGWGLLPDQRDELLTAKSYEDAYAMLNRYKGSAHTGELADVFRSADLIYDKTPRYIYDLPAIAKKANAPIIVTIKTPAEAWTSAQKHGLPARHFIRSYIKAILAVARTPRAKVVFQRQLSEDLEGVMRSVSEFIGLPGNFTMDAYNERFGRLIESRNSFVKGSVAYRPAPETVMSRFLGMVLAIPLGSLQRRSLEGF